MKYHKIISMRVLGGAVLSLLALCWAGCTKNFEERNTDPYGLETGALTPDDMKALFPTALYNGWNVSYQTSQNLLAGMYSQYYFCTQPAFATHRYVMNQQWLTNLWNGVYVSTMPAVIRIIEQSDEFPAINAIARIWKVWVIHRYTDYFGPIPYSQIGNYVEGEGVAYDSQEDIYHDLFKELEEATAILEANIDAESYGTLDWVYQSNHAKWLKFANTLRLRLAMRISFVEPEMAKAQAEAAIAGGVMEENADNALIPANPAQYNSLNHISGWNEFRMSANFESLFKGYNDPRMPIYFEPAKADGEFRGGRSGLIQSDQEKGFNTYNNTSNVAPRFQPNTKGEEPMWIIYAAEAYFLRAEGVLNGWDVGGGMTAEELYNKGIEMSLRQWGITDEIVIDEYINGTSLPIAPAPENGWDTPPLTDIPVKFAAEEEKQREQIGTQKWIALFPGDMEAWAEMRRTGYPKMYPLIQSDNPDMPNDQMIRRIQFVNIDRQSNGSAVAAAEALLGPGGDKVSTRLWWDVKE